MMLLVISFSGTDLTPLMDQHLNLQPSAVDITSEDLTVLNLEFYGVTCRSRNMEMSNNPVKHEVLIIKQYLHSILSIKDSCQFMGV